MPWGGGVKGNRNGAKMCSQICNDCCMRCESVHVQVMTARRQYKVETENLECDMMFNYKIH